MDEKTPLNTPVLEGDTFVMVKDIGSCLVVIMRHKFASIETIPSLRPGEFRLDKNSLQDRIANLKRGGYPTDQSEMALNALEAAIKEEDDEEGCDTRCRR
jgi:hypothetical protein